MGCILKFLLFIFILAFIGAVRFWWIIRTLINNACEQARKQQEYSNGTTNGYGTSNDFGTTNGYGTSSRYGSTNNNDSTGSSGNSTQNNNATATDRKKVFADDEGEYVDFEDIKD